MQNPRPQAAPDVLTTSRVQHRLVNQLTRRSYFSIRSVPRCRSSLETHATLRFHSREWSAEPAKPGFERKLAPTGPSAACQLLQLRADPVARAAAVSRESRPGLGLASVCPATSRTSHHRLPSCRRRQPLVGRRGEAGTPRETAGCPPRRSRAPRRSPRRRQRRHHRRRRLGTASPPLHSRGATRPPASVDTEPPPPPPPPLPPLPLAAAPVTVGSGQMEAAVATPGRRQRALLLIAWKDPQCHRQLMLRPIQLMERDPVVGRISGRTTTRTGVTAGPRAARADSAPEQWRGSAEPS